MKPTVKTYIYHPEIDGLRAVSIIAVVLYHAGLSVVPGGFVGVDVFFVISGYLIIGRITDDILNKSFSFSDFWSRRALRILPSYLLVVIATAAVGGLVLVLPTEFERLSREIAWSSVMASNFLYLGQEGYFDAARDTKPLLHMWSLGVEEQFYIAAPIFLVALMWVQSRLNLSTRVRTIGVILMMAASFYLCTRLTIGGRNYAFYMMPLRAWEFSLGAAAAYFSSRIPHKAAGMVAATGLAAIIVAAIVYGSKTPYPSYYAAIPSLGAALVIASCRTNSDTLTGAVLSSRPMVAIGLVSYAWYLWHWPLLTYVRIYNFGERHLEWDVPIVLISLGLACITYQFLERPISAWRRRTGTLGWRPTYMGLLACIIVIATAYPLGTLSTQTVPASMLATKTGHLGDCDLRQTKDLTNCFKHGQGDAKVLIFGDSQTDASTKMINEMTTKRGAVLFGFGSGGCPSILVDVRNQDAAASKRCQHYRKNLAEALEGIDSIDAAILYSRWDIYGVTFNYGFIGEGNQDDLFITGLQNTFDLLLSKGADRILVIGPTPTLKHSAPNCIPRANRRGDNRCSLPLDDYRNQRALAMVRLQKAIAGYPAARLLDPEDAFCQAGFCRAGDETSVWFNDTNHLSDFGAKRLIEKNAILFDWLLIDADGSR